MQGVRLSRAAHAELETYRKELLNLVGRHIITAEQAMKQQWDKVKRLVAVGMTDSEGADLVPIECTGCAKIVVVSSDVREYTCSCSRDTKRYTFQSRRLERDTPEAKTGIQEYMRAYKGRDKLVMEMPLPRKLF